jgi:hypothetical protein
MAQRVVANIFRFRYSSNGAPAREPVAMFRSLLLMEMNHCSSIDDWVKQLKAFPIWAILSGFEPGNVPGVGTFYDFMKRLWLADAPNRFNKVRHYGLTRSPAEALRNCRRPRSASGSRITGGSASMA